MLRKFWLVSVSLLTLFALVAFPYSASADHAWGNYHWARTANPFTLKVGDNVSSAWDSYLNTTVSDWSQSTVLDLTKVAGQQSKSKRPRIDFGRIERGSDRGRGEIRHQPGTFGSDAGGLSHRSKRRAAAV